MCILKTVPPQVRERTLHNFKKLPSLLPHSRWCMCERLNLVLKSAVFLENDRKKCIIFYTVFPKSSEKEKKSTVFQVFQKQQKTNSVVHTCTIVPVAEMPDENRLSADECVFCKTDNNA